MSNEQQARSRPRVPYWHLYVDAEGVSHQKRCHLSHYEFQRVGPADPQWNDKQGEHPSSPRAAPATSTDAMEGYEAICGFQLTTTDPQRLVRFYAEALGFARIDTLLHDPDGHLHLLRRRI